MSVHIPREIWPPETSVTRKAAHGFCPPLSHNQIVAVPLRTDREAMKLLPAVSIGDCLLNQVDLRRQWISQIVEEVQKVVHLTTEISHQDIRFQAVPYSDTYNENIKTVLFWTCEKYPRLKDWQIFNKAFLRLVRKLHKCVSQRFLKHYFVRKSNLLQYANSGRCQDPA